MQACAGARLVGLVAAAVLALSACSNSAPSPDATTASATKTTLTSDSAGSGSRAEIFSSVAELADSSDLVVVGTAGIYTADLADVLGAGFQRLDEASGDNLPSQLLTVQALG